MGYFSNGTEGDMYRETYCERCEHGRNDDCAVMEAHRVYNYEQHKNSALAAVLDYLIPRGTRRFSDGIDTPVNEECAMFLVKNLSGELFPSEARPS